MMIYVMLAAGLLTILLAPRLEPSMRSSNVWPTLSPCPSLNARSSRRNWLSALARRSKNSGSFEPHVSTRWDVTSVEAPRMIKITSEHRKARGGCGELPGSLGVVGWG